MHAARVAAARLSAAPNNAASLSSGSWISLGPVPLASDASGNGMQDYRQVAGRVTAVEIDAADATGNTVYIGSAQGGVWKSINATLSVANNVAWTPLTDNQPTLAMGAIAIQPGNSDPAKSLILAATGEANNSVDSYFGLGILRSTDAGANWSLVSTANNGVLSFSGLGGTRLAFSSAIPNIAVAAMGTSSEAFIEGAANAGTMPGLYTSLNAGQSWTYNALVDPGGATDATSASSVVYNGAANSGAGAFFAAVRYHGFYSSPDGVHWARLPAQPGGAVLSTTACPPQSSSNGRACPIYRGEITVVAGRNEMYAWYVFLDSYGAPQDGGIWQSLNGGSSWSVISNSGITNCGDVAGCGVEQGTYNLALKAVPNGASATDLYAGAVNLYKCAMNAGNPGCSSAPFMNLTHVFGCIPAGAPAHVHPNQHAIAAMIPSVGTNSGNELLYFANDGGLYRSLNGYSGLNGGTCSALNQFDDLNQNLGSLAQFISFSQHPTEANTLLGGTQGNGSPATNHATTNTEWLTVLGGDGGYNAIDPQLPSNWYAANPDLPPGGLSIQLCTSGISCNNGSFNSVVTSSVLGGDDGAFYFPYILDSGSTTAMLVGTCRVWRGPRTGGIFTALSPNFETLGTGTCSGSEVNQVRALATAGPSKSSNGSNVVYATTNGLGPIQGPQMTPAGGRVWVTTDSSTGIYGFVDVTGNGPGGNINPGQFPISSVAADPADPTGNTAYVGVMGFTGGAGHIWKTVDAGVNWSDFSGNMPDSPVNALVVYEAQVYAGTDVGVFASSTSAANWVELGPNPSTNQPGFLPNAAVTALGVFASGGQQLLRASTYGRGIWQFNLVVTPDYEISVENTTLTAFAGQTATFRGTATALNGYTNSVTLSCVTGTTPPPSVCSPSPISFTPGSKTPFTVSASGITGDYNFAIQAIGSDGSQITHKLPLTLRVVSFGISAPTPTRVTVPRGTASSPISFQITAAGSFNQAVQVACTTTISNATCNLTPGATVTPTSSTPVNMAASVTVPASTVPGNYSVSLRATTDGAPTALTASFTLNVTSNPDFILSLPAPFPQINAGSSGTQSTIAIASQDGFSGAVNLTCPTTYGASSCSISPASVSSFPATATLTINGSSFTAGRYTLLITATSGAVTHSLNVTFNVGDYSIAGPQTVAVALGTQAVADVTMTSSYGYTGEVEVICDATELPASQCSVTPSTPVNVSTGASTKLIVAINVPRDAQPGTYPVNLNSHDTTGAPRHSLVINLTIAQDFVLTSSTESQTVKAGQTSGAYNLMIQPVGLSFDSPVSLACTDGLPPGAQCNFSPSDPVTPGTSAINVLMSVSTPSSRTVADAKWRGSSILYASLCFPLSLAFFLCAGGRAKKTSGHLASIVAGILPMVMLLACSGVSGGAGGGGGTSPPPNSPITYLITVSGSSASAPPGPGHAVVVTLIVD